MKGERLIIDRSVELQQQLDQESDPKIRLKLAFLHCIATLSPDLETLCKGFGIAASTGYWWIRNWNRQGYAGLLEETCRSGRPPRLDALDLSYLKQLLQAQSCWTLQEIAELVRTTFGVDYSGVQLTRILRKRLHMHFGKPFPHDYRRPDEAEALLQEKLRETFTILKSKGLQREEIAIGCVDETSPQNRANTVRFWSLEEHPQITRNTTHFKSNTIGFYALQGTSAQAFLENSKEDSMIGFLRQIRAANETYRAVVVVLDNYVSHKSAKVLAAADELGIYLVHLPPYSPDLNPTEYIWKSMRRVLSKRFIKSLEEMKAVIVEAWETFAGSLSFGEAWIHQFLETQSYYSDF